MKVTADAGRRDKIIAALLWYGTWFASALIAVGVVMTSIEPTSLALNGYDIVKAGIAVFILLPIIRVALTMYLFLRERDYVYTVIAATVLLIIATGIVADFR
ncbi:MULTISPECIES: DUF1634 domain-containing protein [Brucella]|uniref:DUF1634 domain-containing protein n=2 Tax=Brucella TaxID=234 RepID=A6X6I9_BRUA4|nr:MULTISPECIES: DUF1634 domain-containing protein [Brucella]RNL40736.1 DUF1634 domain-containing protein [Ochrobactrum sp. MH181795]ABS16843.1 protein of unknown function DUF1634 [Brucella anthropi ATCC 49188]AIK42425.1 hypothetical protein DR92_4113 [Brucella anthropi]KAB2699870.1 DUF1634 domain-containing protein [Brucella lupini]KAB2726080.1 DUF1634 domain-containing protein [Brucella anthropi]